MDHNDSMAKIQVRTATRPTLAQPRCFPWTPWILVFIFGTATVWLTLERRTTTNTRVPLDAAAETEPTVSSSSSLLNASSLEPLSEPDAIKAVIKAFDIYHVRAYRWSGGDLQGWVEFSDGRLSISASDGWPENAQDLSGTLLIACKDGEAHIWLDTTATVPDFPSPLDPNDFTHTESKHWRGSIGTTEQDGKWERTVTKMPESWSSFSIVPLKN